MYGRQVVRLDIDDRALERALDLVVESASEKVPAVDVPESDDALADARTLASQPPVIRYVNLVIREAFEVGASDIHLEATAAGELQARIRLDGVLIDGPPPPAQLDAAIVSRVKILAELDTAERRRPQDGRFRVRLESRELDIRVSCVPTLNGESVVLRLLDQGGRPVHLEDLGLVASDLARFERMARRPHGLILVTGPTGSGKTSTLYAALAKRDRGTEKIITVEDPIEYQLSGVTQVPVHRIAGVTMDSALRSILRQDPDVIMVGEMRDAETAQTALQSAMTGHLVFSTLHTTSAVGAIPRLLDLGIPGYLVAATLDCVLSQRLVRRICDECRTHYDPDPELVAQVADGPHLGRPLIRGAGCRNCRGTGFRGRTGIFELLILDEELREAIVAGASRDDLARLARAAGTHSLRADGWRKIVHGVTTVEEVLRVSGE